MSAEGPQTGPSTSKDGRETEAGSRGWGQQSQGFQLTEASEAQTLLFGEKQRGVRARECVGVKVLWRGQEMLGKTFRETGEGGTSPVL